jgi:L-lactate dehydrogenase complex protein LldG
VPIGWESIVLGVSQEEFIRSIREAIGNDRPLVELPSDREMARVVKAGGDVVDRFCAMAVDAKMRLYRVAGEAALVETIGKVLADIDAKSVLVTDEPLPRRDELVRAIRDDGRQIVDPREDDCAFTADAGITLARMGIAETGSIVIRSGSDTRRLASLAVPEHIAVLREGQIVPDLLDWAATLGSPMPANEVLITGPSRTADIELNLVMGVHGPKNVHVVLVAQGGPA